MAVSPSRWARGTPRREGHKQRGWDGFGPSMRCFSSMWVRGGACGKVQTGSSVLNTLQLCVQINYMQM